MHVLRVANFVSPTSGGIKTALQHWGELYRERGHQVSLVVPGPGPAVAEERQGTVYRVPATPIGSSGYSLMWSRVRLARLLEAIDPDVLEVSDRSTTRWMGRWARQRGIGSVMVSHEQMTGLLLRRTPLPHRLSTQGADFVNRLSDRDYDAIVCPSRFAAQEFHRLAIPATVVHLGVDLDVFVPPSGDTALGPDGTRRSPGSLHVIHCGRLSKEKNPSLSVRTLRELVSRGVDAHLTVLGHGPLRDALLEEAQDLPVAFHAYISSRAELAAVMGRADVAIAPGPQETFGLAALEALACGVPTVCPDEGALQEVVGGGGMAAPSKPAAFADAVLALADRAGARAAARAQAETFSWEHSADLMLQVHHRVREQAQRRSSR